MQKGTGEAFGRLPGPDLLAGRGKAVPLPSIAVNDARHTQAGASHTWLMAYGRWRKAVNGAYESAESVLLARDHSEGGIPEAKRHYFAGRKQKDNGLQFIAP